MGKPEWVKLVLEDLISDLARAQARLDLVQDENIGEEAARALSRIHIPALEAYEGNAREALAALGEGPQ